MSTFLYVLGSKEEKVTCFMALSECFVCSDVLVLVGRRLICTAVESAPALVACSRYFCRVSSALSALLWANIPESRPEHAPPWTSAFHLTTFHLSLAADFTLAQLRQDPKASTPFLVNSLTELRDHRERWKRSGFRPIFYHPWFNDMSGVFDVLALWLEATCGPRGVVYKCFRDVNVTPEESGLYQFWRSLKSFIPLANPEFFGVGHLLLPILLFYKPIALPLPENMPFVALAQVFPSPESPYSLTGVILTPTYFWGDDTPSWLPTPQYAEHDGLVHDLTDGTVIPSNAFHENRQGAQPRCTKKQKTSHPLR